MNYKNYNILEDFEDIDGMENEVDLHIFYFFLKL